MAKRIILTYLLLIGACCLCLKFSGMGWFDAVCHSLSTISTGGASTKNNSIAGFNNSAIEWVTVLFMFLGALPLAFYYNFITTRNIHSLRSEQVGAFIKILLLYIVILTAWLSYNSVYAPLDALRYAAFNVVSLTSSSGFYSADYLAWGAFPITLGLIFSLTGGCSGSTSGSIKIFRWQVIFAQMKRSFITITEPNRLLPLKIGKSNINSSIAHSIFIFLAAYVLSIVGLTALVSLTGIDFMTAFGSVVGCITNVGSNLNSQMAYGGSYADFSDAAKAILSFTMILGRLEVLTIFVLFTKNFWH